MSNTCSLRTSMRLDAAVLALGLSTVVAVAAQPVPPGFIASPDIYQVSAENEQYRVITVTWQPGQRDVRHSHPVAASYILTDCALRMEAEDGTTRVVYPKAGLALVQPAIASHTVANIGTTVCKLVMFEPK